MILFSNELFLKGQDVNFHHQKIDIILIISADKDVIIFMLKGLR